MAARTPPFDGICGITVAAQDVDATREAWCRLAGATDTPALVVGGVAVGVGPAMGEPPGLTGVTLRCEDVSDAHHLLGRRGLATSGNLVDVGGLTWRLAGATGPIQVQDAGDLDGIDHVVVTSTDPDRAAAQYGARLGLDLRLDRMLRRHRMRGLFFELADSVVEVVVPLDDDGEIRGGAGSQPDAFGGIAWRTSHLEATRARLIDAEVDVSEVRAGRKEGTCVATVRDPDLHVPTLLIGAAS